MSEVYLCAVAAVHDGYVLNASIMRSPVGGRLLNECLQMSLASKGITLHPWYLYSQVNKASGAGTETIIKEAGNITESHIRWGTEFLASDIKESHCRMNELPFVEEDNVNMPMQTYELPDGSNVDIGVERFKIPEILFNPVRLCA
jgi:actin-like protein 6A